LFDIPACRYVWDFKSLNLQTLKPSNLQTSRRDTKPSNFFLSRIFAIFRELKHLLSMLSFLKKWFGRKGGKAAGAEGDPVLDLGPHAEVTRIMPSVRRADVHRLMVQATALRRKKGYHEAVRFLQELAEQYLREKNTALVATVNKLVPYMKKDRNLPYEEARTWLEGIIRQLPASDPYFLNVHITMAELLQQENTGHAIAYLENFLKEHPPAIDTYYHLIRLADFFREEGERETAQHRLEEARRLWDTTLDRYRLIKMQRRWHHSMALLTLGEEGEYGTAEYLFHRFMEFALDMARALDPAQPEEFHKRKDQYFKGERGFAGTASFEKVMERPCLEGRRDSLLKEIYGFVFEEMPLLLGVGEKELHFRPGDPETLEEVRKKKLFASQPFTQYDVLAKHIRKIGI
jgi:tetratricopeptide (TPR) repeat protein